MDKIETGYALLKSSEALWCSTRVHHRTGLFFSDKKIRTKQDSDFCFLKPSMDFVFIYCLKSTITFIININIMNYVL